MIINSAKWSKRKKNRLKKYIASITDKNGIFRCTFTQKVWKVYHWIVSLVTGSATVTTMNCGNMRKSFHHRLSNVWHTFILPSLDLYFVANSSYDTYDTLRSKRFLVHWKKWWNTDMVVSIYSKIFFVRWNHVDVIHVFCLWS